MAGAVHVRVGSVNPVKAAAVEDAFAAYFARVTVEGVPVPSGVADQPVGDETMVGARNRARTLAARGDAAGVGYHVGIEGGIVQLADRWFALGCMCVLDHRSREGYGTSPLFELPAGVVERLRAGEELGAVIDEMTGDTDTKRKGGAIGHFTRGVMDRKALYRAGLVVALVPFVNEELYLADRCEVG